LGGKNKYFAFIKDFKFRAEASAKRIYTKVILNNFEDKSINDEGEKFLT
jgi:hypothetical protein